MSRPESKDTGPYASPILAVSGVSRARLAERNARPIF